MESQRSKAKPQRELIVRADGTIIPAEDLTSPEQLALLQDPTNSDRLSVMYHGGFHKSEQKSLLDSTIYCARNSIKVIPPGYLGRKKLQYRLGNYLCSRYSPYGAIEDLDEAQGLLRQCVAETYKGGDPDSDTGMPPGVGRTGDLVGYTRAKAHSCLAGAYKLRYEETGLWDDYEEAERAMDKALDDYF